MSDWSNSNIGFWVSEVSAAEWVDSFPPYAPTNLIISDSHDLRTTNFVKFENPRIIANYPEVIEWPVWESFKIYWIDIFRNSTNNKSTAKVKLWNGSLVRAN